MNSAQRLQRLRDRRQGFYSKDGTLRFAESAGLTRKAEKFERLSQPESVKYALGAMQPVDKEYTDESYAEGNRVANALLAGLNAEGIAAEFDLQGSVPLDVHVRGNSDVDLLALHGQYLTYDRDILTTFGTAYQPWVGPSQSDVLADLRNRSIEILKRKYWGAKVDTTKSKAVTVSEGAFTRFVDVVPSHWHNTLEWHGTRQKHAREVYVFDSHNHACLNNKPFLHIKNVSDKCTLTGGNLRKVARLLKNLRYDADEKIDLSSYDIVSVVWNMAPTALVVPFGVDLLLVERARQHLAVIVASPDYRDRLKVPDGSRKIFDNPVKVGAVTKLYLEVDRLAKQIAQELNPAGYGVPIPYRPELLERAIVFG